jgi:hypothetical protein
MEASQRLKLRGEFYNRNNNQRLGGLSLLSSSNSCVETCAPIKWAKLFGIKVCAPMINKNEMKKEIRSQVPESLGP